MSSLRSVSPQGSCSSSTPLARGSNDRNSYGIFLFVFVSSVVPLDLTLCTRHVSSKYPETLGADIYHDDGMFMLSMMLMLSLTLPAHTSVRVHLHLSEAMLFTMVDRDG